jgi:hypothetical protein
MENSPLCPARFISSEDGTRREFKKSKHDDKRKAITLCPLFHELFSAPITLVEHVQVEPFDPLLKSTQL